MLQVGSRIQVKSNAYKYSRLFRDKNARGKIGHIVFHLKDEFGEEWKDCWVAQLNGQRGEYYLATDEIRKLPEPAGGAGG